MTDDVAFGRKLFHLFDSYTYELPLWKVSSHFDNFSLRYRVLNLTTSFKNAIFDVLELFFAKFQQIFPLREMSNFVTAILEICIKVPFLTYV